MTLDEIQEVTGVPADTIIKELGLPPGVPKDEGLGRLKQTHGFAMEDVRRIVEAYEERKER
jgi:hypothetical protein